MLINYYRMLLPYKWYVYWCSDQYGQIVVLVYTPDKYDCHYGPTSGRMAATTRRPIFMRGPTMT